MWAGLGVTVAAQNAFNRVWAVPHRARPNFFTARVRGFALLVSLGVANLASTVVAGVLGAGGHGLAASQLMLIAAEVNVVWTLRLWPRSIAPPPLTESDEQALTAAARTAERGDDERVRVTFDPPR